MTKRFLLLTLSAFLFIAGCSQKYAAKEQSKSLNIIPIPAEMELGKGTLKLTKDLSVQTDLKNEETKFVADFLAETLRGATDFSVPVVEKTNAASKINLRLTSDAGIAKEGYALDVNSQGIQLSASTAAGLFYGTQTILQLLPPEVYESEKQNAKWAIPFVKIEDQPRFGYRGMHLDVARHFFPVEFIKKYIDIIALHKMNVLHWHLTDDQGWRIEIKKYPKLTQVSAFREQTLVGHYNDKPQKYDGKRYGGFYTQEQIKDIVEYAQERFVTIIPEIEMPGHALAVLAAYPEFSCTGGSFKVGQKWGVFDDVFCAGNDAVFTFLQDVLAEVVELFPGKYVHIGGDECPKTRWEKCEKCQARIKAEGLKDEHELQSYVIQRMEKFLASKGKRLIGWDEILEGGLAPQATVMSWRGIDGGIEAAKQGHDVIMTPTTYLYFDYYQSDPETEPLAIGGHLTLEKVYSYEPMPSELTEDEAKYILGAQANVWTEYMKTSDYVEYMALPRMTALAEIVWSPKEKKNWKDFQRRLVAQFKRFDALNINYGKGSFDVTINTQYNSKEDKVYVQLETEQYGSTVRFTTDGTKPGLQSPVFKSQFPLEKSTEIQAAIFDDSGLKGDVASKTITVHKALGKKLSYKQAFSDRYPGGGETALIDGLVGSESFSDGNWQGFSGNDMEVVIDLGKKQELRKVSTNFVQSVRSWVFMPLNVKYAVSSNGKDFQTVGELKNDVSALENGSIVHNFSKALTGVRARYIKVLADNRGTCPPGHPGEGGASWIFADEIIVE
jgi:hexosaminidase